MKTLMYEDPHLLKGPDTHVKMWHITAAPALVAVIVVGVVTRTGVTDLDDDTAITSADAFAVQVSSIAIIHAFVAALNLKADPTGATELRMGVCKCSHIQACALVWPDVIMLAAAIMYGPIPRLISLHIHGRWLGSHIAY